MVGSILPVGKSDVDNAAYAATNYLRGTREWARRQVAMWGDQGVDHTFLMSAGYDTATANNIMSVINSLGRLATCLDGGAVGAGDNIEFVAANLLGLSGN